MEEILCFHDDGFVRQTIHHVRKEYQQRSLHVHMIQKLLSFFFFHATSWQVEFVEGRREAPLNNLAIQ
jgi:hypothetical protein